MSVRGPVRPNAGEPASSGTLPMRRQHYIEHADKCTRTYSHHPPIRQCLILRKPRTGRWVECASYKMATRPALWTFHFSSQLPIQATIDTAFTQPTTMKFTLLATMLAMASGSWAWFVSCFTAGVGRDDPLLTSICYLELRAPCWYRGLWSMCRQW